MTTLTESPRQQSLGGQAARAELGSRLCPASIYPKGGTASRSGIGELDPVNARKGKPQRGEALCAEIPAFQQHDIRIRRGGFSCQRGFSLNPPQAAVPGQARPSRAGRP